MSGSSQQVGEARGLGQQAGAGGRRWRWLPRSSVWRAVILQSGRKRSQSSGRLSGIPVLLGSLGYWQNQTGNRKAPDGDYIQSESSRSILIFPKSR